MSVTNTGTMIEETGIRPPDPSDRMVIEYLQKKKEGATFADILNHLKTACGKDPSELSSAVMSLLENGTALGFLERQGSHYKNWMAREACGRQSRRVRSCSRRRRRRRIRRRRSCGRRKRRPRRC